MPTAPDDAADAPALFVTDGRRLQPTGFARGPWSPGSLHGGPVAALLVREVERVAGADVLQLCRVTVELLRPVPLAPLEVSASVVRPGRKVQLVDAVLEADGVEVAWARCLRVRTVPGGEVPERVECEDAPPPPESAVPRARRPGEPRAFHSEGMELRSVEGGLDELGPATVWFRLRHPVVLGEVPSPTQRAVAAADFSNGISAELDFTTSLFINPDLTVSLTRPPEGEWVALVARTRFGAPGTGVAESSLWDERGRIGRAVQNLLVEVGR